MCVCVSFTYRSERPPQPSDTDGDKVRDTSNTENQYVVDNVLHLNVSIVLGFSSPAVSMPAPLIHYPSGTFRYSKHFFPSL